MDNLKSLLEEMVGLRGDKKVLFFRDRHLTYRELDLLSNRFSRVFRDIGVRQGDHVAVMLSNCPEWIACWFGLAKLGAVLVAFNTQWKADGLEYALRQADVKYCLVGAEFQGEFKKAGKDPGLTPLIFDPAGGRVEIEGAQGLSSPLAEVSSEPAAGEPLKGGDPLIITYTSGTTGWPKAVLNPHRAYIAAALDLRDYAGMNSEDIIYTCLPLYHANPQVYCVLTGLAMGGSIALAEKFSASRFWQDIRTYQATAFSYVGAVLPILLNQPEREEEKNSSAKKCFGGGAPKEVHEAVTRRFGLQVCELYGMSETGTWNTINRPGKIGVGGASPRKL